MSYPGLKLFMEKLKQMIYSNDISQISNHPSMLSKRPQLQLLYEELGSMIQTLSVETGNDLHELEEVRDLKKRFKDVAEEAQDVVDLFVSDINFISKKQPLISHASEASLDLEDVMRSIKSIQEDFISICHNMKMESTPRTASLKTQSGAAGGTSCYRNSLVWDEVVVGLDRDVDLIRGKLAEDTRKLDVVSIVGTGGIGKTTLATKVFNDPYVVYYFHVRGWVTVSQTYDKTDLLNQLLASIGVEIDPHKRDTYSYLREQLHKCLTGKRYLVVIDDIWNTKAWDYLQVVFQDHEKGSRLLLTSRHKKVALHAKSYGLVHQLSYLTDQQSWELLSRKVFHGNNSVPDSLNVPGMQIARNCRGLPLSVVLIAGVLAKESATKDSWEKISRSGSALVNKGHRETLALSLNHLPSHLRDCFLYLGGFPEDYRFGVTMLIWLWIAEGFIEEVKSQSLEETATDYLMELLDRNLVVIQDRKFDRAIKTISVHDSLRELCLEVATKERVFLKLLGSDQVIDATYKTRRIFTDRYINSTISTRVRSLLSFCSYPYASYIIGKCSHSWTLLLVLDLKQCPLICVPEDISLLVNLRYLAIRYYHKDFQSRICDIWSLQTLIIEGISDDPLILPNTLSNLLNLRHLWSQRTIILPPLQTPIINLQTISSVSLMNEPMSWKKYFPCVKKLSCVIRLDRKSDFKSLTILVILRISSRKCKSIPRFQRNSITFPALLKKLTLKECHLPWSCMSKIQCLPNLEVLKLLKGSFVGRMWDAGEEPFQQLKFLKLVGLDIRQWEASSINFPRLEKLYLGDCHLLKGIPLEMKYIPTLEHIEIKGCNSLVTKSAYKIQEEQHADGNHDLKISSSPLIHGEFWNLKSSSSPLTLGELL
ncbi:putative P-loop containing nucleoside triphosphate hydrolase, leucine-rich repeat domain superfamily [Helianthus debilis subsp. tardiflorus]